MWPRNDLQIYAMAMLNSITPIYNLPMTVFSPENAAVVAVNSALPRFVRGRLGRSNDPVIVSIRYGYEVLLVGLLLVKCEVCR